VQRTTSPEADRAPEVAPELRPSADWRVISVDARPDEADLHVRFADGTEGVVEMKAFLNQPNLEGTVFETLRDPAVFARATVILGAVTWPNGADLAPDAMYDAIRDKGRWIL